MATFDQPTPNLVVDEIVAFHQALQGWLSGGLPGGDDSFEIHLGSRLAPNMTLIPPAGSLLSGADLRAGLRNDYGLNPEFRIQIRTVRVRAETRDIIVATYQEWQRNALNSTPANNGRVATVLFDRLPHGGLQWRHVHETWLPSAVMAAGPFDF